MSAQFFLKNLVIQNFATFKNQTIHFRPGFNAIMGETGSGKSLVLDALQLILGGRADKKVVRRETDYSLIEATFYCTDKEILHFLEQEGYPAEEHELIIKRIILKNGSTKSYINHLSCTVSFLTNFARRYIDIVGQFENQKLLSEAYQLQLLDQFAKTQVEAARFADLLKIYRTNLKEKERILSSKIQREQRLDYLSYQLQEIERLNPSSQDEEDLLKRKHILINREKSQKLCFQMKDILEGDDLQNGLIPRLKILNNLFIKNHDLFPDEGEIGADLLDKMMGLSQRVENKLDQEVEAGELEQVIERLDSYQKLKKKFGGSVESILQSQVEFLKEKSILEELDSNFEALEFKIQEQEKELLKLARALHQKRRAAAGKLGEELTSRVRALKMSGATIKVELEEIQEFTESGMSRVCFLSETNMGEGYFRIKDIASGGELSRILLSVRQILSSFDSISIFLFDEIDTGIGGETALCIGKALQEVSSHGQVIAITHLPQIAQFAEVLVLVNKDIQQSSETIRTESSVREVVGKMIIKEVKAMAQLH